MLEVETPLGRPMCAWIQTTLFEPCGLKAFHDTAAPPIAVPLGGITHAAHWKLEGEKVIGIVLSPFSVAVPVGEKFPFNGPSCFVIGPL